MKEPRPDAPRWRRRGWIGNPAGTAAWAITHAALPVVEPLGEEHWSVFLTCRDASGRSHIGRCELTLGSQPRLSPLEEKPVLSPGALGTFDDSGVTMSCLVTSGEE